MLDGEQCLKRQDQYKAEIISLKFTAGKQNEKIFALEENAVRLNALDAESTAQLDGVKESLEKTEKRLRRKNIMIYAVGALGTVTTLWALTR